METRRSREIKANQGVVKRGIFQFIRMIVFLGVAFWLALWLFNNEYVEPAIFYRSGIPSSVPVIALQLGVALFLVMVFQLLYFILYVWLNPKGRRRAGHAFVDESEKDNYTGWDS